VHSGITQSPAPGATVVVHRGNVLEFVLSVPAGAQGTACLRTNLGRADLYRAEIIEHVKAGRAPLGRDWHDIPMRKAADSRFCVSVPLVEVGRFQAKAYFRPEGASELTWPEGGNTRIKVEPSGTCCANTVYTAFVRLFTSEPVARVAEPPGLAAEHAEMEKAGYTVIPQRTGRR